jgi:hypothetical protein
MVASSEHQQIKSETDIKHDLLNESESMRFNED